MPAINIFSPSEIKAFETPPIFTGEERKRYFRITKTVKRRLRTLRTPHSQIGFLLHLGYFRKSSRFYSAQSYHEHDLKYLMGILNVPPDTDFERYSRKLFSTHKKMILDVLGFLPASALKKEFGVQVGHLVRYRTQPKAIIYQMQEWCKVHRSELFGYDYMAKLISNEINGFEENIFGVLAAQLTQEDKESLDNLIVDPLLEQLYPFNELRKIIKDDKPGKIKTSLASFFKIKNYYTRLWPVMEALQLPIETFKSYGLWLSKAKKFQVVRLNNPYLRYLHLLSFIHFQFHLWQDAYVIILLNTITRHHNLAKKAHKAYQEEQSSKIQNEDTDNPPVDPKIIRVVDEKHCWERTMSIVDTGGPSAEAKLAEIGQLVISYKKTRTVAKKNGQTTTGTDDRKEKKYYDFLEEHQRRLSLRVSAIIQALLFDHDHSNKDLITAIDTYRTYDQIIKHDSYTRLFNEEEKQALKDHGNKFRAGLCKILFYRKIADGIRSGTLNLKYSYKYLAVDRYLIDLDRWEDQKDQLIDQVGLHGSKDVDTVLKNLEKQLEQQYKVVHERFVTGKNPYLKYKKLKRKNRPQVKTPALADKDNTEMATLFEDSKYVLLPQILSDIQRSTGFINCFEHLNIKHKRKKPDPNVFLACLIGHGCNLGTGKMGQIAKGLEGPAIANTFNWYFSLDNILKANDKIVAMVDKMALSNIFRKNANIKTSSSDGQKFEVAVPSLHATYSLKYLGTGKGISVYSFINDKYALFYNTVMTASDREAPYVVDGILHNEVERTDEKKMDKRIKLQHSTDTHGFTEVIFGTTHLLDISFAPRLKNYGSQIIYGFKTPGHYKEKGYFWLPSRTIDTGIIRKEWDNILRLITTIRLKEVPASIILKRLSSYARQNPLYKALKEFGRIIKTIFLLRYIDDVELRQQIQYQLSIVELSHQFARAVFFGRSGEFYEATQEQQKIVAACRMLVQNSVILWNYLHLSKKVMKCETPAELENIFKVMRNGAMITWQHVHLQGTYNFKEEFVSNFSPRQMAEILDMNLENFIDTAA